MLTRQSGWHQEAFSKEAPPHEYNRSSPLERGEVRWGVTPTD